MSTSQEAAMHGIDEGTALRVVGPERLRGAPARRQFIASMQPVLALRHPNLARIRAVTERGDSVAVVTDAVNGATLESILAADPELSVASIQSILTQVATALQHAHAAGVIHGALTSSCVVIDPNGDAIVTELGLASALADAGVRGVNDDAVELAYASPEVIRGEHPTASSDQYALGTVAYELLAGRRPFDGSADKLRHDHLGRRPEAIHTPYSELSGEWPQAVMRMLAKRPADRFASLADAMHTIAPKDNAQDERFRGTLGWLVQQQLSGAPFVPSFDTVPRRVLHFSTWRSSRRGRALVWTVGAALSTMAVASLWHQLSPLTRMRLLGALPQLEQRPQWYDAMPARYATSTPAVVPPVSTVIAAAPADRALGVKSTPRHVPTAPRAPAAPARNAMVAVHVDPVALHAGEPALEPPDKAPVLATAPPVVAPLTNSAPASAPALEAEPHAPAPTLSIADASAAARTVVDQLRGADVRALGASMVASKIDEEFINWLRRRPVDLKVGAPASARVVPLPDGSAQVSYAVPITWTHASGARPTRPAMLTVAVRPSPTGPTLAGWSLAEPFVP